MVTCDQRVFRKSEKINIGFTSRLEIVSCLQSLVPEDVVNKNKLDELLKQLPPALCRAVLRGHDVDTTGFESVNAAFTGSHELVIQYADFDRSTNPVVIGSLSKTIFDMLPLDGYQLCTPTKEAAQTADEAFFVLDSLDRLCLKHLTDFTGMVVHIEPKDSREVHLPITSVSIPKLPFCTFYSKTAHYHVAPDVIFPGRTAYALAENLYHESLHQALSFRLLMLEIFNPAFHPAKGPKIAIPWRGVQWELDRVLHAAFVYSHLFPLRKKALDNSLINAKDKAILKQAIHFPSMAVKSLKKGLLENTSVFSELGLALVEAL